MTRSQARPSAPVTPYVLQYLLREGDLSASAIHFVFAARNAQFLEFYLGEPCDVVPAPGEPRRTAPPVTLVGNQGHGRVELFLSGFVRTFTVVFRPTGFHRLFGFPMAAWAGQGVDAGAVLGGDIDRLTDRLQNAKTFAQMCAVADEHFSHVASRVPDDHVFLRLELGLKAPFTHRWSVDSLADAAGYSNRQLDRMFLKAVGATPKRYLRVERLQAALDLKQVHAEWNWGRIALEVGYFDQMHLVRDFKDLAGTTPSKMLQEIQDYRADEERLARSY